MTDNFRPLCSFELEGVSYAALIGPSEEGERIYFYRIDSDGMLQNLADETEFEAVAGYFREHYEELVEPAEPSEEDDSGIIVLEDEGGFEHQFMPVGSVSDGGVEYLALVPLEDNEDGACVILRRESDEDGEPVLSPVDDDEFERISALLQEKLAEGED